MELASSDAAAILFFLEEEKEKNGGANWADSVAHPYQGSQKIHGIATPVCALARNAASVLSLPAAGWRGMKNVGEKLKKGLAISGRFRYNVKALRGKAR